MRFDPIPKSILKRKLNWRHWWKHICLIWLPRLWLRFLIAGNYSCLVAHFYLKRSVSFHLIQSYLPSILIVAISWVSFWMDIEAVPGRISLGVITLLAVSSQAGQGKAPPLKHLSTSKEVKNDHKNPIYSNLFNKKEIFFYRKKCSTNILCESKFLGKSWSRKKIIIQLLTFCRPSMYGWVYAQPSFSQHWWNSQLLTFGSVNIGGKRKMRWH